MVDLQIEPGAIHIRVMIEYCELWANKTWHSITVEQALTSYAERQLRCPECHGAVRPHRASSDGAMQAHFEHRIGHTGCSRAHKFDGSPRPHPKPLDLR